MAKKGTDRIECRTPTPGKKPTRIDRWKFDALRRAILEVVPATGGGTLFTELPELIEAALAPDERANLGSLLWYLTTVKLELEVRGELRRVPNAVPQRLIRVVSDQAAATPTSSGRRSRA